MNDHELDSLNKKSMDEVEKLKQIAAWKERSEELTGMMMGHAGEDYLTVTVREFNDLSPEERALFREYGRLDEEFWELSNKIRDEAFWMIDYIREYHPDLQNSSEHEEIQLMLKEMSFVDNTTNMIVQHPVIVEIAREIIRWFKEEGGPNFVEMDMVDPETMRRFKMTVKPVDRPDKEGLVKTLRTALEEIHNESSGLAAGSAEYKADNAYTIAHMALKKAGYLE